MNSKQLLSSQEVFHWFVGRPTPTLPGETRSLRFTYLLPLLACMLPFLLVATPGHSQEQPQALVNPSVETGVDAPQGWSKVGGLNLAWDTSVAHEGTKSLVINDSSFRQSYWESERIPFAGGDNYTWYQLSGWIKTEASSGVIYLALAWYDAQGQFIRISPTDPVASWPTDWMFVNVSDLPPTGAQQMALWCASDNNSSPVWYDDLSLTQTLLPRQGALTPAQSLYEAFLAEYPNHPLAAEAHYRLARGPLQEAHQLQWERKHAEALSLFLTVSRQSPNVALLQQALAGDAAKVQQEQARYNVLIDEALFYGGLSAVYLKDYKQARQMFEQLVARNLHPQLVPRSQANLEALTTLGY